MKDKPNNSDRVELDNPFDLIVTDDGLTPTLNGVPVTMDEYRAYYAERNKHYKPKYRIR